MVRRDFLQGDFEVRDFHAAQGFIQHIEQKRLGGIAADVGDGFQQAEPQRGWEGIFRLGKGSEVTAGFAFAVFAAARFAFIAWLGCWIGREIEFQILTGRQKLFNWRERSLAEIHQ